MAIGIAVVSRGWELKRSSGREAMIGGFHMIDFKKSSHLPRKQWILPLNSSAVFRPTSALLPRCRKTLHSWIREFMNRSWMACETRWNSKTWARWISSWTSSAELLRSLPPYLRITSAVQENSTWIWTQNSWIATSQYLFCRFFLKTIIYVK